MARSTCARCLGKEEGPFPKALAADRVVGLGIHSEQKAATLKVL